MNRIAFILLLLFPVGSLACSFARVTEEFVTTNQESIIPEQPNFTLTSIHRGTKGNIGSCNDAGSIKLTVNPEPEQDTGYVFSISQGEFEDQLFGEKPIVRVKKYTEVGEYSFIWLDGYSVEQEPIDIVIRIVAVSKDGGESEPQFLKVSHPGVKKPWWKFW
ncbi:hypothetical protein [Marinobacterium jannaschii]|uniref:hypothetical protein n=1 Tax=Marinobacterium jannaschii TaxID=64970 RepID=UPI000486F13C|nr:hypothetical protein [Marinobacterium jannaschii]